VTSASRFKDMSATAQILLDAILISRPICPDGITRSASVDVWRIAFFEGRMLVSIQRFDMYWEG